MTETAPQAGDGVNDRLARLEAKVAELQSMLVAQANWMSDMQGDVTAGLERMSGAFEGLASHTEWLTSLERWVSSCVKTLASFGAQPLDTAEPGGVRDVGCDRIPAHEARGLHRHGLDLQCRTRRLGPTRVRDDRHPQPTGDGPGGARLGAATVVSALRDRGDRRLRQRRHPGRIGWDRRPADQGGAHARPSGCRRHIQYRARRGNRGNHLVPRRRQLDASRMAPQHRVGLHHLSRGRCLVRRQDQRGSWRAAWHPFRDAAHPGVRALRQGPPRAGQLHRPEYGRVAVLFPAHPLRREPACRIRLGSLVASVCPSRAPGAPGALLLLPDRRVRSGQRHP